MVTCVTKCLKLLKNSGKTKYKIDRSRVGRWNEILYFLPTPLPIECVGAREVLAAQALLHSPQVSGRGEVSGPLSPLNFLFFSPFILFIQFLSVKNMRARNRKLSQEGISPTSPTSPIHILSP
jgi:hypothetical protein